MNLLHTITIAIILTNFLRIMPVDAAETPDPAATTVALQALLAASNEYIPPSSTCFGEYGQVGKPTVKDLIAVQLAYFYRGENVIEGNCKQTDCELFITHRAGADVSSTKIEFTLKHRRLLAKSLKCIITP